ncbi:hypothetical protein [Dyadobacter sp. SG02]|uniref:hypothetical protein n=1 Tax=Dyadobacter sp. SG02 TaxID=1855291 RepID=UPI001E512455|nr:hypothetical protein [Dyadobacter sp. SG02]
MVPPGTNDVSPTVSINHHSMGGNGVLGQGWDIGGLSKITCSTRNMYFNNETNPVLIQEVIAQVYSRNHSQAWHAALISKTSHLNFISSVIVWMVFKRRRSKSQRIWRCNLARYTHLYEP